MAALMNHRRMHGVLAAVLILGLCAQAWAVEFAGGTGEPNDPYQIATAEQLIGISSDPNLFDRHFVLTADIDLDSSLPGRKVFRQPVIDWPVIRRPSFRGAVAAQDISISASAGDGYFHGSFDGGGHAIRNCMLVCGGTLNPGFLCPIAPRGVVRDLRIEDMMIANLGYTTGLYPGLLTAINLGTVVDCSATGMLMVTAGGGLIGLNKGLVVGCRTDCEIFGGSVGGLIGVNEAAGRVILCESRGVLYADGGAGGLVGTNKGTIQYSTSHGFVSAASAGGLVYDNDGLIRECCVTATLESGGGVTYTNDGTIINCYSTGLISGTQVDGLAVANNGTILSSYSTTISQDTSTHGGTRRLFSGDTPADSDDIPIFSVAAQKIIAYVYYLNPQMPANQVIVYRSGYGGTALSEAHMTRASSFVGFDFYNDATDGPAGHWFMPSQGYPVLTWQTEITGLAAVPDVSGLSPEQTRTVLECAGHEPSAVRYDYARSKPPSSGSPGRELNAGQVIMARPTGYLPPDSSVDVVVSLGRYDFRENSGDGSEGQPFQIGTAGQLDALREQTGLWNRRIELVADIDLTGYVYPTSLIEDFSGQFNGNGHTIRNLQCGVGLFGRIKSDASVHDLILADAWVLGVIVDGTSVQMSPSSQIGILAGENVGQVLRCSISGSIPSGLVGVGGLVAGNAGQLADCRFSGRIRANFYAGGLAGTNTGVIVRCCARDVDISASEYVGGLVGQSFLSTALIEACYATGTVKGGVSTGGLVGQHGVSSTTSRRVLSAQEEIAVADDPVTKAMIRDCYAACFVWGQQNGAGGCIGSAVEAQIEQESCFFLAPEDGGGPDNGLCTALTDEQMKQQASFAGWDFEDVWTICEGRDYPRLRWEQVECSE